MCELPSFYSYTEPVARKKHRCCECSAPINKGEKHFHGVGCWEGDFSTYRQHRLCMAACMFIRDHINHHECIGFGELKDYMSDHRMISSRPRSTLCDDWKQLRHMFAQIRNRERKAKHESH